MRFAAPLFLVSVLFVASAEEGSSNSDANTGKVDNVETTGINKSNRTRLKTIDALDDLAGGDIALFTAPDGETYMVASRPLDPEVMKMREVDDSLNKSVPNKACEGEGFDASERKAAKISIARAPVDRFSDLNQFLDGLRPVDQEMVNLRFPISKGPESQRVRTEIRNVYIETAWLYSYSRQSDEDYHVIIGTTPDRSTARFINVEISGLPAATDPNFNILATARKQFKDFLRIHNKCRGGYIDEFIDKPVFVRLSGSLFFDRHHYIPTYGNLGHYDLKPKTYWEIHPVTQIEFGRQP